MNNYGKMKKFRILAFDLARGLAVLFMVMVHVLEWYGTPDVAESLFGYILEYLGGPPAAPVFMFLMGASLVFSRRATVKRGLRRGIQLLLLAYALNFLRGTLPLFLGQKSGLITPEDVAPLTPGTLFWVVDILQFAGLALIILGPIRRFFSWPILWVILSGSVALGSPLLWGRMSGWPVLDWFLMLLWGTGGEQVAFPVFPWLSYPLAGLAFGHWLTMSDNRNAVFKRAAGAGGVLLAIGTITILTNPDFHLGDYWRSGPGAIIWMMGFVLLWLAICHWLVTHLPANVIFNILYSWSAHVTVFYVIHWMIIGWGLLVFGVQKQEVWRIPFLITVVAGLTDVCTRWWHRRMQRLYKPAIRENTKCVIG